MIAKVKSKYWRSTHIYGVKLPKTAAEALVLDPQTGQPFWANAMKKEMGKAEALCEEVIGATPEEVRQDNVCRKAPINPILYRSWFGYNSHYCSTCNTYTPNPHYH